MFFEVSDRQIDLLTIFVLLTVNIEDAVAYQKRRRNIAPALYNHSPRWLRAKRVEPRAGQNVSVLFQFHSGKN